LKRIPKPERFAAMLSVAVGLVLMAIKFTAYFITGSAAIFSDALESIVNVAASAVAFYSLFLAHTPADESHPYGHGKAEFLSAGFEGGMVLLASIAIGVKTIDTLLFHTIELQRLGPGLVLIALAMIVNGATGAYLIFTGRRHNSLTLEADGHHLLSDAVTSVAALVALVLVKWLDWPYADPIAALLVAGYLAFIGTRLLRRSAAGLMDEQDVEDDRVLQNLLHAHIGTGAKEPRICSFHKLRHRHSGRYHWVDFHIMVPSQLTVEAGHTIASALEHEIEQTMGEGKATAHVEPCPECDCDGDGVHAETGAQTNRECGTTTWASGVDDSEH
jgi:cation diffusion facilitator family transporter